jgi:hypothetical protein
MKQRPRLFIALAAVVAVVAAVAVVLIVRGSGGGGNNTASSVSTIPTNEASLSVGGRELVSLLNAGREVTFHATYRAIGDPKTLGGQLTFEVWQLPPRAREDTVSTNGSTVVRTESFVDATSAHLCSQTDQKTWVCHPAKLGASRGPQGMLATIGNEVAGQSVAVVDNTVAGRQVKCFTVGSGTSVELCATPAGIPVLIADSSIRLELISLSSTVGSSTFKPPANDT